MCCCIRKLKGTKKKKFGANCKLLWKWEVNGRRREEEKGEGRNRCNVYIFLKIVGVVIELWKLEPWEIKNNKIIIIFRGLLLSGEVGVEQKRKKKDVKFIFGRA